MAKRAFLPAVALMLGLGSAVLVAQRDQSLPASVGDLNATQLVEVRTESGEVVLNGTFVTEKNTAKVTEREAELKSPTGQTAKGKVDVDIERKNGVVVKDEVEIEVENLPAMTTLSVHLDGQPVASFVTTKKGKAEIKLTRKS